MKSCHWLHGSLRIQKHGLRAVSYFGKAKVTYLHLQTKESKGNAAQMNIGRFHTNSYGTSSCILVLQSHQHATRHIPSLCQLVRSGLPCIVKQIRRLDIVVDDLSTSGVQVAQAVPESASCQEIQQFQTQIIILEKVKGHHLMFLRFRMAISWSLYVWIIQAGPRRSENQDLDDDALGFLFWHRPMHLESHVQRFSLTQLQDHGKNCRCTGVYLKVLA